MELSNPPQEKKEDPNKNNWNSSPLVPEVDEIPFNSNFNIIFLNTYN